MPGTGHTGPELRNKAFLSFSESLRTERMTRGKSNRPRRLPSWFGSPPAADSDEPPFGFFAITRPETCVSSRFHTEGTKQAGEGSGWIATSAVNRGSFGQPLVCGGGHLKDTQTMPVSGSLLQAATIPVGSEIWTDDEDGDQVWMQAEVIRQENTSLTIRRKSTGEELEIDLVSSCSRQRGNYRA